MSLEKKWESDPDNLEKSENRIQKSRALVYWTEVFADTKYGLRWYYHARKTHFLRIDRSKFWKTAPL